MRPSALLSSRAGRALAGALAALVVLVLIGLVALWPGETSADFQAVVAGEAHQAQVEQVAEFSCPLSRNAPCQQLVVVLEGGPDEGRRAELTLPGTDTAPDIDSGDQIRVIRNDLGAGLPSADQGVEEYAFVDFERRGPIYVLAALFAVLVVAFGRWKGLRSLVGLAVSLVVVTQFIVPAILEGSSPVLVALVGSLAVMLLTLGLTHGAGVKSATAAMGAAVSLLATALLAVVFVELASITGFSSEEATLLRGSAGAGEGLSLEGLVLAGMVVAALGVLDDVTVSQASVVLALQRVDPRQRFGRLFSEALSVGRDHLGATVNTLVFAYVGAALPILLIFENQGTTFGEALNRESVAEEVVAMLVGSIGLILAVPLTTALAAWMARQLPVEILPDDHHHHHH